MEASNKPHKRHLRATKSELERLRLLIRGMNYQSWIYRVLRDELTILGYWKTKARGNPALGYANSMAARSQTYGKSA